VLELFDASISGARLDVALPAQFQSTSEGLFRVVTKGERLTQIRLTNYQAAITANIDWTTASKRGANVRSLLK